MFSLDHFFLHICRCILISFPFNPVKHSWIISENSSWGAVNCTAWPIYINWLLLHNIRSIVKLKEKENPCHIRSAGTSRHFNFSVNSPNMCLSAVLIEKRAFCRASFALHKEPSMRGHTPTSLQPALRLQLPRRKGKQQLQWNTTSSKPGYLSWKMRYIGHHCCQYMQLKVLSTFDHLVRVLSGWNRCMQDFYWTMI